MNGNNLSPYRDMRIDLERLEPLPPAMLRRAVRRVCGDPTNTTAEAARILQQLGLNPKDGRA